MVKEEWGKVLAQLCMPFPDEAYEVDDSRGFVLTGIKGYYVIDRLNAVFGPCGFGWKFVADPPAVTEKEVIIGVTLFVLVGGVWSEGIRAIGSSGVVRERYGDAQKGALTDGIKKAASLLGVGLEAYTGQIKTEQKKAEQPKEDGPFTYEGFVANEENCARAAAVEIPFGKHKGKTIAQVDMADRGYLAWFSEQPQPDREDGKTVWAAARYYRAYRTSKGG